MALQEQVRPIDYSLEREQAAARKRIKDEYTSMRENVRPISNILSMCGHCAIVMMQRTTPEKLITGLKLEFGDESIHEWSADGNVQGSAVDEQEAMFALRELASMDKSKVIILSGVDYKGGSGRGTLSIAERLVGLVHTQQAPGGQNANVPRLIAIGPGSIDDLPSSGAYQSHLQGGIAAEITVRFGYDGTGVPSTYLNPTISRLSY